MMFKLVKEKMFDFIVDRLENYNRLINNNPHIMKALCKKDPHFIKYAQGKAATLGLLKIALSHDGIDEKEIIKEALGQSDIGSNPEAMKYLCSINGNYFAYCRCKAITFENYQIALSHEDPNKKLNSTKSIYLYDASKSEVKKFIQFDGRLLKNVGDDSLTEELIDIALSNPDPQKRPDISECYSIRNNKKLMKHLCSIDGKYLTYATPSIVNADLLKIALNNPDPDKRLSIDKIPSDYQGKFDYSLIRELCKQDKRWFKYVDYKSINEEQLLEIMANDEIDFIPTKDLVEHFKDNNRVLEAIIKKANEGKYTIDELCEMLKITIDRKFINSKFFKEIVNIICENKGIDYDFVKYHMERAVTLNNDILKSINIDFLHPRYQKVYEENGYEKLYHLVNYPFVQKMIITIGSPQKPDGSIDYELGDKKIELLSRMLKTATVDKKGQKIEDWIPYYSKIIKAFDDNPELFNYFASHLEELDEKQMQTLTNHFLGQHPFEITSIEDLKNYEKIRENWINQALMSNHKETVQEAILEKVFGISYSTAKELYYPYNLGISKNPDSFHPGIVDFFQTIDIILNNDDVNLLITAVKKQKSKVRLDEKDIIHLHSMLKKQHVRAYNATLFSVKGRKADDVVNGVKMYKAAGEKGNKPFNISISALGAYSEFDPYVAGFNYSEDWNRPQIANHGICTSYIGNNHLGIAHIQYAALGFTEYEDDALLLSGPTDIYSENVVFDVTIRENRKSTYLLPQQMLDTTRHTHNEMVYERRVGNKKRQPSYVVLVCDDYEETRKSYETSKKLGRYKTFAKHLLKGKVEGDLLYNALKAAEDFGVPIVIVERKKIAQSEHDRIFRRLDEFMHDDELNRDEIKSYFHDIIVDFENNHTGNREYHKEIDKLFFNGSNANRIMSNIKRKIKEYAKTNPELALIMIEELENVMKAENEKEYPDERIFDIDEVLAYCGEQREILSHSSKVSEYAFSLIDGTITDTTSLMEYNKYLKGTVKDEEQLSVSDIHEMLPSAIVDKLEVTISRIDNEELYTGRDRSAHSRKHAENVVLFSTIIGVQESLSDQDMDLLLTAALYHDAGRVDDKDVSHAKTSSSLVEVNLAGKYPKEDLQIIRAVIEYHEVSEKKLEDGSIDYSPLEEICRNLGIDVKDEKKMERVKKLAHCLKDADALDRTRFVTTSEAFLNPDFLHFETSHRLIRVGMQLNEHYASIEIERLSQEDDLFEPLAESLKRTGSPKMALHEYHHGKMQTEAREEEIKYGK